MPPIAIDPVYLRITVASGADASATITVRCAEACRLLAVEAECPCVRCALPLPHDLVAGVNAIPLRITGVLPGPKTLTVRTTTGSAQVTVAVVTPGFGEGAAIAAAAVAHARANNLRIVAILHDLRGETRNCGCSSGSLGGLDHLAGLSQALPQARLIATGAIEGGVPGVCAMLAGHGWELRPPDVVVTSEPLTAVDKPGVLAVIATGELTIAHQRVVRPVLDRGALVHLLLVDAQGTVTEQRLLPIDRTLPVATDLSAVPAGRTRIALDQTAAPQTACASCHPAAQHIWTGSAHARALASLSLADQTTACAVCHSTPLPGRTERAPNVSCTACHQNAEAHAVQPMQVQTAGVVDCRSCHDAQHHPSFDRVAAWLRVQHGK